MRAGVFLAYWPWFTPAEQVDLAMLADRLGLDSVWVAEAWGQDALSVLRLLRGKTDRGAPAAQAPRRRSGLRGDADARAQPDGDRDGRGVAVRHQRRALPARPRPQRP